jgi:hypothetical protein
MGLILAGVWFVVHGLVSLGVPIPQSGVALGLLALLAGILLLVGR